MNKKHHKNTLRQKSFPQVFCIKERKMAYFGTKIQVFRIIHRVFHSFAHREKTIVENFFHTENTSNSFDKP